MRQLRDLKSGTLGRRSVKGLAGFLLGIATAASPALAAGETSPVILGSGLGPPYIWYMTAVDSGIMEKHGINAEYKIFPSGVEAMIAVGAGEAHVSNGSCSTVMRARANGSRFLVVARNIVNPDEHKLIASEGIKGPQDLKGKKIGMLTGSSTDWYATKYLAANGLEAGSGPDQVELVSIGAPEWVPALQRGDIAAYFGWQPWVSRGLEIVPGAHVLHNGGDEGLFILMNCMVFNEDWVKNDPESAKATMAGIIEAHDAVEADRAAATEMAGSKMRIPAGDLLSQAECCTYRVDFTSEFMAHAREAAEWAQSKGMLGDAEAMMNEIMYPDVLRQADPGRADLN